MPLERENSTRTYQYPQRNASKGKFSFRFIGQKPNFEMRQLNHTFLSSAVPQCLHIPVVLSLFGRRNHRGASTFRARSGPYAFLPVQILNPLHDADESFPAMLLFALPSI